MTVIEKYKCDRCEQEIEKYKDKFQLRAYPGELQKLFKVDNYAFYIGDTYIDLCPSCADDFVVFLRGFLRQIQGEE